MSTMPSPRIASALALTVLTAGLGAGCGSSSSDTSSAADWADGVCGAIVTWRSDLTSIGANLKSSGPSKASLQTAAEEAETATKKLGDNLKSLGKPDTQSGADAQSAVNKLQSELTTGSESIKKDTDGISTLSETLSAVSSVSATLATMATQISSTISTITSLDAKGELQQAFSQSSNCKTLQK
jgi:uncharacterized phage infection (PIP) family protein YhgE